MWNNFLISFKVQNTAAKKFHIIQIKRQLEDDQRLCSSGLIWYLSDSVDQKYETLFCEDSTYSEAA